MTTIAVQIAVGGQETAGTFTADVPDTAEFAARLLGAVALLCRSPKDPVSGAQVEAVRSLISDEEVKEAAAEIVKRGRR